MLRLRKPNYTSIFARKVFIIKKPVADFNVEPTVTREKCIKAVELASLLKF